MADHSKPRAIDAYSQWPDLLAGRMDDLARGLDPATTAPSNLPGNAIGWSSALKKWLKWTGSAWVDLSSGFAIPVVGGSVDNSPIGAATPSSARFTTLEASGDLTAGATVYGGSFVGRNASTSVSLRPATADGADDQAVHLSGGGALGSANRGAYLSLHGNEHASAGAVHLSSGVGGDVRIMVGGGTVLTVSGATGYVKHAYGGSVATPAYTLGNSEATGFFGTATSLGFSVGGVQAARFYDGYHALGGGNPISNVFQYNYGTLSQAASAAVFGRYDRVTFNSDSVAGKGTSITQSRFASTIAMNDAAVPNTVDAVYGIDVGAFTLSSSNAASTVTLAAQFRAQAMPDGKVAAASAFRGEMAKVAGVKRWNGYNSGNAPNYNAGDLYQEGTLYAKQSAPPATITASATLAASALLGRLILAAGASSAITLTLPDGGTLYAAASPEMNNFAFDWSVINTSPTYAVTVAPGTSGHSVVGNMAVAANTSGAFRTRVSAASAFVTYRVA